MRVLIVDSNIVYAKRIKNALECYVNDITIDLANDVFVTKRRLAINGYDLIIADILTVANQELMAEELKRTETPVIAWTTLSQKDNLHQLLTRLGQHVKTIRKPYNEIEFQEAATIAMTTASGIHQVDKFDDAHLNPIH